MREVGIIKWFGGFNPRIHKLNDFGYILRDNQPDLYVNRNHLHCKAKLLIPGTVVSFEIGVNYKNNMEQALKVKLLKNEKEKNLVKTCVFSSRREYYMPLIVNFFKEADDSDIEVLFPKILNLDKEEKRRILDSMDMEFKERDNVFKFLDIEEKINILFCLEENKLFKKWGNLDLKVKIFFIYRLCSENKVMGLIERLKEKDLFIRAMLIIAWVKCNKDKKYAAYKKACELIYKYSADTGYEDSNYEDLKIILPKKSDDFKVDISKSWKNWSILEFIQYCNGTNILEDIDRGNRAVIILVSTINNFMKRFNI